MNANVRSLIQGVRREAPLGLDTWHYLIQALLDDFRDFLGEDFERDVNPMIEVSAPTVVQWIWSKPVSPASRNVLSQRWSGVLAGNLVDDPSGLPYFAASVTVFLFSGIQNTRLHTHDGKTYLLFTWRRGQKDDGAWISEGWFEDQWGEWKDITEP